MAKKKEKTDEQLIGAVRRAIDTVGLAIEEAWEAGLVVDIEHQWDVQYEDGKKYCKVPLAKFTRHF